MAIQDATELTLKIDDDTGNFIDVGGFRTNFFDIMSVTKPYQSRDTAGWRTLADHSGYRSLSASGEGIFHSHGAVALVLKKMESGKLAAWQIKAPGLGVFEGLFSVTKLTMQGKLGEAVTYSITLDSSGPVTMIPLD